MRKFTLYVGHVVRLCVLNPARFMLSIVGLAIGLVVLTAGNILVESFFVESLAEADQAAPDTVVLTYQSSSYVDLGGIATNETRMLSAVAAATPSRIYAQQYVSGRTCTLTATLEGTSEMNGLAPVPYAAGQLLVAKVRPLKGRLINASDVAQRNTVTVIDDFTARVLFSDGDPIGRVVTLDVDLPGTANVPTGADLPPAPRLNLTVVGVIANSRQADSQSAQYNRFLAGVGGSTDLSALIYLPISIVDASFETAATTLVAWSSRDPGSLARLKARLMELSSQGALDFAHFEVSDRQSVLDEARSQLEPVRVFLVLLVLVLLGIAGASAMSTMFFAVKERIPEIGVKKALGATGIDILTQFIIEGMFVGFVAAIVGAVVGVLAASAIETYLTARVYVVFHLSLTRDVLLLPIIVGPAYGFTFSLLPSAYGASIKVTQSLRFE